MNRLVTSFALSLALVCSGCGGSSAAPSASSTAPVVTTTTTSTTAVTFTSGVFTFTFAAGTLIEDQTIIRNAVLAGASLFQSVLGRSLTQPTTISVVATSTGGCASGSGFASARSVTLCGVNVGWLNQTALSRQKIAIHELTHTLQVDQHWNSGSLWIAEGAAEYMGWRGVASMGLITFDAAVACMVRQANDQAPATANLSTMETSAGFGNGAYPMSMLGIHELVTNSGAGALVNYGDRLASGTWQAAFESAFGTSTTAFYAQYPTWRATLGAGTPCL